MALFASRVGSLRVRNQNQQCRPQRAARKTCANHPANVQGAKIPESLLCIAVGLLLYFAVPRPGELTQQAWALTAIFVATILGLVLQPLPVAPVALAGEGGWLEAPAERGPRFKACL